MIKYTLPDFTHGLRRNLFFIRLQQSHPHYFIDNLCIDSVYGCVPDCILNGGRAFIREKYSPKEIEETFNLLAEAGVKIRLTLTNMLAKKEHLDDPYVATMLDIAQKFNTEAIVYSDELADALKKRYGFKCVLSTTRGIENIADFNEAAKQYDYVVLSYNLNKDYEFIDRIDNRAKVEIMVNEFCQYQCPHREEHYLHNSEDQMNGSMRPFQCHHREPGGFFDHAANHPVFLTTDNINELHRDHEIDFFKIVGRGIHPETVLEAYAYYLVRPPYRQHVKQLARTSVN